MQNQKIKNYFNIARKANYVIFGGDNLKGYKKKLFLIVQSSECGNNLKKITQETSTFACCELIVLDDKIMQDIIGISNCKAFGIKNKGIADMIIKNLRGEIIG